MIIFEHTNVCSFFIIYKFLQIMLVIIRSRCIIISSTVNTVEMEGLYDFN